ncbi:TraB/GumN family protein [Candidatus Woesearchaeota archaeon]|nr:TraB/GumN family protein [Candidatus Woesearchaeota archaeon]
MHPNIKILGTSHIAKESIKAVQREVQEWKPDIIAVELDKKRLYSLEHNIVNKPTLADIRTIGVKGYLFLVIGGWMQRKLGNVVDIKPGSDMLEAVRQVKANNLKLALIDQDMQKTLKRFNKMFGWKEKWQLIKDIITAPFTKEKVAFDLDSVPNDELITRLTSMLKVQYPGIYTALIHERNVYMVDKLKILLQKFPDQKILAVVGAGHKEGMLELMKKDQHFTISSKADPKITYTVSYS